jgi:hypothetical protein
LKKLSSSLTVTGCGYWGMNMHKTTVLGKKKEKEKLLFSIYLHMKQFQEHIPSYTTKMH